MAVNVANYEKLSQELKAKSCTLVAVSKTKPAEDIRVLYELGQRDFGENYVQELIEKKPQLPTDIRWHFIGHLQRNKVKYIAPFCYLIHGVDSISLLKEINKQGEKLGRKINCLLQVHIAQEETKFGMDAAEVMEALHQSVTLSHVTIAGLMGMASFSDNQELISKEFNSLCQLFNTIKSNPVYPDFKTLSMGMSGDYPLAIEQGSTMVRVGSLLFGARDKHHS
jgi:pyridoxal phosphate enzyme (YggS family)